MQSRNQWYCVMPPIFWRPLQVFIGEDRKNRYLLFFCNGNIRIDFALHMMSFPYCIFLCLLLKKIKNKKNWGVVAGWSLLRYVSSLMYFTWIISLLCIDELFLHMVENISLTYAKFPAHLL
jgi:hypothetical protein